MLFVVLVTNCICFDFPGLNESMITKYRNAIDQGDKFFRCFDGSKIIPMSQFNDNYRDCEDGSDEPNTAEGPEMKFICQNAGHLPIEISRWSVGDGICDCCDGSDELFNPKANCPNTCATLEEQRQHSIEVLREVYAEGIKINEEILAKSTAHINKTRAKISHLESQLEVMNKKLEVLGGIKVIGKAEQSLPNDDTDNDDEEIDWDKPIEDYESPKIDPLGERVIVEAWNQFADEETSYIMEPMPEHEHKAMVSQLTTQKERCKNEIKLAKDELEKYKYPEFAAMIGQKFKFANDYKMKFLKEIKHESALLGKFTKYNPKTRIAKFRKGFHCWQTKKAKIVDLEFVCSNRNQFLAISEPDFGKFKAVFSTPSVCIQSDIDKLENMTLEELIQAREIIEL